MKSMSFTDLIIALSTGGLIILDIIIKIFRDKTGLAWWRLITECFREYYLSMPIVPFAVAVVFLGHFINQTQVNKFSWTTAVVLSIVGVPLLVLSIYMRKHGIILPSKWIVVGLIIAGWVIGDLFW